MSLSRLMTRALACVALQKQEDDAVSPTMAEDRVFDSRLDPLIFREFQKPMPGIIVYTDDDDGEVINYGSGGPYRRYVDLRVELVIGSFDTEKIDNEEHSIFNLPMTDAQMEAQLDLFEAQVKWALYQLPGRVYTLAFAQFVKNVGRIKSEATRDEEGNNKFATRRMLFRLEIPDDCPPTVQAVEPGEVPDLKPFCEQLEAFPAPWIRPLLKAMCNDRAMRGVLSVLAGVNNPTAILPLLKRIGMNVDAIEPEADPNLLAAQGKTHGPDGRIEVHNTLELP